MIYNPSRGKDDNLNFLIYEEYQSQEAIDGKALSPLCKAHTQPTWPRPSSRSSLRMRMTSSRVGSRLWRSSTTSASKLVPGDEGTTIVESCQSEELDPRGQAPRHMRRPASSSWKGCPSAGNILCQPSPDSAYPQLRPAWNTSAYLSKIVQWTND